MTFVSSSGSNFMHRSLHPPLVESFGCYCRAESSVSTVGDNNLHPGSKRCTLPDVKPSLRSLNRNRASKGERKKLLSDIIPGLPNDLAVACLLRVPRLHHRKLRLVCRKWYRLLTSNFFFSQRIQLGFAEDWVYVVKRDREGRVSWQAFDPKHQLWQPLPPIPPDFSQALGFGSAVISGHLLFLFGGKDKLKGSMRKSVYYSPRTNKWHHAPEMLKRRHFFASCVMNNCIFVAGGECEGIHRSLRSAEMFDPSKNRWCFISDMSTSMVPFIGIVHHGQWFLKGLGVHREVMSEVYSPDIDQWCPVFDGMVAGWRNPCVSFNDQLYALDCPDGCRLRMYDEVADSWIPSLDSKLHLGNSHVTEASALIPVAGKLCIVRNNLSIVMVDVANGDGKGKSWTTVAGRGHFMSMMSSFWSNISGRNRATSQILHCQVLQA